MKTSPIHASEQISCIHPPTTGFTLQTRVPCLHRKFSSTSREHPCISNSSLYQTESFPNSTQNLLSNCVTSFSRFLLPIFPSFVSLHIASFDTTYFNSYLRSSSLFLVVLNPPVVDIFCNLHDFIHHIMLFCLTVFHCQYAPCLTTRNSFFP